MQDQSQQFRFLSLIHILSSAVHQQNLTYNPRMKMKEMSVGEQQMIEIIKTVYFSSKIVIMDEPTSSLSEAEVKKLFNKIRELKESGSTILYISHRLEELDEICDYLTVMRDGCFIKTAKVGEITRNEIIYSMVGREITDIYPKETAEIGNNILRVEDINNDSVHHISFHLKRGEILGFAGLVGAGRTAVSYTHLDVYKRQQWNYDPDPSMGESC